MGLVQEEGEEEERDEEEKTELSFFPHPVRTQWEGCEPGREFSPDTVHAGTQI